MTLCFMYEDNSVLQYSLVIVHLKNRSFSLVTAKVDKLTFPHIILMCNLLRNCLLVVNEVGRSSNLGESFCTAMWP